jgi:HEAT repeat protein
LRELATHNKRIKLTGAANLVSRGVKFMQAAPAAYPYRSPVGGQMLPMVPDTAEVWLPWLDEPDSEARELGALRFCATFSDGPAIQALPKILAALEREPEALVRRNLVRAIHKIDPWCVSSASALRSRFADEDPDVRSEAVYQLGRLKPTPPELLAEFQELWQSDPDESVRMAAAVVVSREAPDASMGQALSKILIGSQDQGSRLLATLCLQNLGQFAQPYREALRTALTDSDEDVRRFAAEVLEAIESNAPRPSHSEEEIPF